MVRDLVHGQRLENPRYHDYTALGVQPDGQVIVAYSDRTHSLFDCIFSNATVRPVDEVCHVSHIRTNYIARAVHPLSILPKHNRLPRLSNFRFEDWKTGSLLLQGSDVNLPPKTDVGKCYPAHIQVFVPNIPVENIFISLKDPSSRYTLSSETLDSAIILSHDCNGIVLAYLSQHTRRLPPNYINGPTHLQLTLIHLETHKTIASAVVPSDISAFSLIISRFHVFLFTTDEMHVFDFTASYLYSLRIWEGLNDFWRTFPKMEYDGSLLLWKKEYRQGPDADEVVVFDPMRKSKRKMVRPFRVGEGDTRSGRGNGYYFVIREYPIDQAGKRTGAPGQEKMIWRRLT
ncbi:hypothetical protein HDV00_002197 [Rhizophlyctis rosea]|nr:hypothetical protein HDV00_002197 [Rhizophlyctis rosea]